MQERNHQVGLMSKIYSQDSEVLMWLRDKAISIKERYILGAEKTYSRSFCVGTEVVFGSSKKFCWLNR